jgi:hypothetical protein
MIRGRGELRLKEGKEKEGGERLLRLFDVWMVVVN